MIRIAISLSLILLASSCTGVSRDYYYGIENNPSDWVSQYIPGKNSDKNGTRSSTELLKFKTDNFELGMHISFQDTLGSVVNPYKWFLTDLSTGKTFNPASIIAYQNHVKVSNYSLDSDLEINGEMLLFVQFPIGVDEVERIKLNVGDFILEKQTIAPSEVYLRRVKGGTRFNQFTL